MGRASRKKWESRRGLVHALITIAKLKKHWHWWKYRQNHNLRILGPDGRAIHEIEGTKVELSKRIGGWHARPYQFTQQDRQ